MREQAALRIEQVGGQASDQRTAGIKQPECVTASGVTQRGKPEPAIGGRTDSVRHSAIVEDFRPPGTAIHHIGAAAGDEGVVLQDIVGRGQHSCGMHTVYTTYTRPALSSSPLTAPTRNRANEQIVDAITIEIDMRFAGEAR